MEQRFRCTACGKCCYGEIPLTLDDALANADRFPLAMVWTPVRQGTKVFQLTSRLGTTVQIAKGKTIAVLIAPTAFTPPDMACPALAPDMLCSIHDHKPMRCRTMPFYPYRNEDAQFDVLVPRKNWMCDTSETAPVVYKNGRIVDRRDFDRERESLMKHACALDAYAKGLLKVHAPLMEFLAKTALNPMGRFIDRFSTFLLMNKIYDILSFAKKQHPVLVEFADRTASMPNAADHHKYYKEAIADLAWFAKKASN